MPIRSIVALLILAATGAAVAAGQRECFTGYAYELDSDVFVYTEHHEQTRRGNRIIEWRVTYRNPEGGIIADRTMDFSHNPFVPVFTLTHKRSGDMEGIRREAIDQWRMIERDGPDGELLNEPFEVGDNTVADSGFHPFVPARFEPLMAGETVRFHFAVAGSLDMLDMRARRIGDTEFEGERAVRFRTELDMLLVNWFVDAIVLTYDPESKRLLEYRRISNMQNEDGERYQVRVSYYSDRPDNVPDTVSTECSG